MDLYRQGKKQEAYQKSVDAYLDGFELAEPALFREGRIPRARTGNAVHGIP
jgi:hypothetical protein